MNIKELCEVIVMDHLNSPDNYDTRDVQSIYKEVRLNLNLWSRLYEDMEEESFIMEEAEYWEEMAYGM